MYEPLVAPSDATQKLLGPIRPFDADFLAELFPRAAWQLFRSVFTQDREIPIMERVGIYCMVYSMLEDRLETFWWNCSFIHKWDVIPSVDNPRLKRPPKRKEWEKRIIPKKIRQTGSYANQLERNGKISKELKTRLNRSDDDRREIIHRNMFNMKDVTKDHIKELMDLFREFDKLLKKHKKKHSDKFEKS